MKIDLYGSMATESGRLASSVNPANTSNVNGNLSSRAAANEDRATLDHNGYSVQALTTAALATGDSRAAKVTSLTQAVQNGQYQLDSSRTAEAIVSAEY